MISFETYTKIQRLKDQGIGINQTARELKVNYTTVKKYWDVTPEQFYEFAEQIRNNLRRSQYEKYESAIKNILTERPFIPASKIYQILKEESEDPDSMVSQRTMRNYVRRAKNELGLV